MKKTLSLLLAVAIYTSFTYAQDGPCPEWANTISLLDVESNTSSALESPQVENKAKKKGLYRGIDNSVRLLGGKSSTTLGASGNSFVYRPFSKDIRPEQQIRLYNFESKGEFRQLVVGGTNMFGGSKNKKMVDTSIKLSFEKISDGCYKVEIVDSKLAPGEYAFGLSTTGNADIQSGGGLGNQSNSNSQWYGFRVK